MAISEDEDEDSCEPVSDKYGKTDENLEETPLEFTERPSGRLLEKIPLK